jgi:protein-tyrosine phosphatase
MTTNYVRLPLQNAYNVRDLGGYAGSGGRVTRWQRFLRADDLHDLTEPEVEFLIEYGVRTVVDLRSAGEVHDRPDPFVHHEQVAYYHLPLGPDQPLDQSDFMKNPSPTLLQDFYVGMLRDSPERIGAVFARLAAAADGGTLFHCAAGKDRTGIVSMLLLGMAGARDSDIVSNYTCSYEHIMENPQIRAYASHVPQVLIQSSPETIRFAMSSIRVDYGGFKGYLNSCGIGDHTLERIAERWLASSLVPR